MIGRGVEDTYFLLSRNYWNALKIRRVSPGVCSRPNRSPPAATSSPNLTAARFVDPSLISTCLFSAFSAGRNEIESDRSTDAFELPSGTNISKVRRTKERKVSTIIFSDFPQAEEKTVPKSSDADPRGNSKN